jgi:hypothetical protein
MALGREKHHRQKGVDMAEEERQDQQDQEGAEQEDQEGAEQEEQSAQEEGGGGTVGNVAKGAAAGAAAGAAIGAAATAGREMLKSRDNDDSGGESPSEQAENSEREDQRSDS